MTEEMSAPQFIHLNVRSTFSLLEGLPGTKKIAAKARKFGMPAVGITDTNNLFGAVEISKNLPGKGIQPIIGVTLGLTREGVDSRGTPFAPDSITLLVQNQAGWHNIMALASKGFLETDPTQPPQVSLDALKAHNAGLIALSGNALTGRIARLLLEEDEAGAKAALETLSHIFSGRFYVELQRHGLHEEKLIEPKLVELAYALGLPLVATNECRFLDPDEHKAFEVLMCIGQGVAMTDPSRKTYNDQYYFKTAEEMLELFADLPEATQNTVEIAKRCAFKVPTGKNYMPVWEDETDSRPVPEILHDVAAKGLEKRLNAFVLVEGMDEATKTETRKTYQERLDYELGVIGRMGFDGYFLIVSDFCRWAKEHGIPVGPGRGSGAGSLVAWCLEITNVDPIRYHLLFERFLNPDRVSLPDFDIDFCQERRGEVIQYVAKRYGAERVSHIITYGTLKARACIKDVGRVLQMPFGQCARIAAFIPEGPKAIPIQQALDEDERLRELYDTDQDVRTLLDISLQLEGAYRHCSLHAAGVIISGVPITEICPLYKDPKSAMPATQFSMGDAEAAGLVKFDFLGLKTLTVIRKSLENIKITTGKDIDIDYVPLDDTASFDLCSTGNTVGVFQVEGTGMQQLMRESKPSRFEDLVALIALYRPGPMENIPDFIARKHGKKPIESIHPSFDDYLTETYGIIVYQEQVMQCAQQFAGYTLGGADILRRAMGKKKQEEMDKQRAIFIEGAVAKQGVSKEFASNIFDTIDKFAGYGFNKSHALAYAVVSYHTLWLKTHYPKEFLAASMTLDRGNSEKVFKFKQELERMGYSILPPDINASLVDFAVEGEGVRFALAAIKGAGADAMAGIVAEREQNGPYRDVFDFAARMDPKVINRRQFEVLIKCGAFDAMEPNRQLLLSNVDIFLGYTQTCHEEKNSNQIGLFGEVADAGEAQRPMLRDVIPFDQLERLAHEQQALGFYLSAHPLDAFKDELAQVGRLTPLAEVEGMVGSDGGKATVNCAGIILDKREVRTKSGRRMAILMISDSSGQQEAAMFPEAYDRFAHLTTEKGPLIFELALELQGETLRIAAESMRPLDGGLGADRALRLKLGDIGLIDTLRTLLADQPDGPTPCELVIPTPEVGPVLMRLQRTLDVKRSLRLKLDNVPGLGVEVVDAPRRFKTQAA